MAEKTTDKKYLSYDGLITVVDNVKEYTDSAVDQKSQVQIIESGTTEVLSTLEIYKLTQEEYEQAVKDGTIVENAIYLTPEEDIDLSGYATIDQLNSKADRNHGHEIEDVNQLQEKLDALDNEISTMAKEDHKHSSTDITDLQDKLDEKSEIGHTHDYAASNHTHDDAYYKKIEIDAKVEEINKSVDDKADEVHSHAVSEVTELQNKLDEKVSTHTTINGKSLTSNITLSASDVGADISGTAETQVSNHNVATDSHNDIRELIKDLTKDVTHFLDVDETTVDQLSEVLQLIENNKGTLESLTTSKVNISDIIDNLETAMTDKVLSANQGVAIKVLIDDLQLILEDHKKDKKNPHEVTLTQLGVNATASELNVLDGVTATTTELNYVDGVTSAIQTQLDSKSSLGHNHTDVHYTKEEVDELLSQKSAVQIITWEVDD